MRKRFLIITLQIFISGLIVAQTDFRDGYLITRGQDTIFGKINNRNYYDNSQFCDFKDNKTNSIVRYYPSDMFGYRFKDGKYYISKEIGGKKVFMEYLIKGRLSIFFKLDDSGKDLYYASKDTLPLSELKYSSEIEDIDGSLMMRESKDFIRLLTIFTSDCPSLREEISHLTKPNQKDLIRLAKEYNNLTSKDETYVIYEKKAKIKVKLGIYGGSNITFGDLPKTSYISYGFNLLFQTRQNERIYAGIGLFYEGKIVDNAENFYHTPMSNSGNNYRIPLSVNYIHSKKGFSPVLSYQLNLNRLALQNLDVGVKYQEKNTSILLMTDLKTEMVVKPYGAAIILGITFDL